MFHIHFLGFLCLVSTHTMLSFKPSLWTVLGSLFLLCLFKMQKNLELFHMFIWISVSLLPTVLISLLRDITGRAQLLPMFLYIATVIFLKPCAALGYGQQHPKSVVWSFEVSLVYSLWYYLKNICSGDWTNAVLWCSNTRMICNA